MCFLFRCKVPECEQFPTEFQPTWLNYAIPFDDKNPKNCERFQYINLTARSIEECSTEQFDQNIIEGCDEFVYKTP